VYALKTGSIDEHILV